jgi:hypothetical protein
LAWGALTAGSGARAHVRCPGRGCQPGRW